MKCSFRGFTWMADSAHVCARRRRARRRLVDSPGGKTHVSTRGLCMRCRIAQDVTAVQQGEALGGSFLIVATAKPGHTIAEIEGHRRGADKLRRDPPEPRELQRVLNQIEASFYRGMERVGGFGGKADQLNAYYFAGGGPDFYAEDLARYVLSPTDIQAAVRRWLPPDRRVELIVEPATRSNAMNGLRDRRALRGLVVALLVLGGIVSAQDGPDARNPRVLAHPRR